MENSCKVAVVTGGGRGIGRAIAIRLSNDNYVVCVADLIFANAENVAKEIHDLGYQALAIQVDVRKNDQVQNMIQTILEHYGKIDILVNNAGIFQAVPFHEMTEEQWDQMLDVHLKGTFLCSRAVIDSMARQHSGTIINIASTSGITGGTSGAHYAAAKGGIIALTRSLGRELASQGIRVNGVAPSKILTDMLSAKTDADRIALAQKIPIGRTGNPEEIANIVAFLASDEASYIVGEVIVASGGY